jgi:hypothetical protein
MNLSRHLSLGLLALLATMMWAGAPASAQQPKPNILFIMGDDIGWMQPGIYQEITTPFRGPTRARGS